MSTPIKVANIKQTDLRPKLKDPRLSIFLPKWYFSQHYSFELVGCSNAVSSAIRRTVGGELLVKAMGADYENLSTTDEFIIPEMILRRLMMIPVDQKCPIAATFELVAENTTAAPRDVKTREIRIVGGGQELKHIPFNDNITVLTLNAGKKIKITGIRIIQSYGYASEHGMFAVAVNAVSVALDQQPINMYADPDTGVEATTTGISSSMSDPRHWALSFTTNGTMDPPKIVSAACENIISRVASVVGLLDTLEKNGDESSLTIAGESDTIGNLFMKTILDLYPDIRACTYSTTTIERSCTIRIRCDEDVELIYREVSGEIIKVFKGIAKAFSV